MTPSTLRPLAFLCLLGGAALTLSAQGSAGALKELNALLASSCFNKPVLTLAADGTVVRTGRDGSVTTFALRDIGDIVNDRPDAQANILLRCRDGKACITYAPAGGGPKQSGTITVFTITPNAPTGGQVLNLFKELQAASAAGK